MYSTRAESGEKLPKSAKSSDRTGEKKIGASMVDKEVFRSGASGEKVPKGALSSDTTGERKMPIAGGVGMGKMDGIGARDASHMGRVDGRTVNSMTVQKSVKYILTSELGTFKINKS